MKKLLPIVLLLFVSVSLASADLKVATVDLSKAFDGYYKTKEIQTSLKQKQDEAQKQLQDKVADYQRIGDEVQKLDQQARDQTLSTEARAEKAKARDQRGADLQAAQRQIEEFRTERSNELKDELIRRRKEVVDEITKVINDYSGPQGFDLVVDKSSASAASGVSIILYSSGKLPDITEAVVAKLNAGAPAGTVPAPAASATH